MVESNYEVLGVSDGAPAKEIQEAFRKLALLHHSDRGGDAEKFKRIKQAYEDLKAGKRYPDTTDERLRNSRVYTGDDEAEARRRNTIIAREIAAEMRLVEEWAAALARSGGTATRLFGSKSMGEMEFERKANGALSIKGNVMAGKLEYDGPITIQGSISSPSFSEEDSTVITCSTGDFRMVNPIENKYRIENGAAVTAKNGNIIAGNVFGRKMRVQDPGGKVGLYLTVERRTRLYAPHGEVVVENAANTVEIDAESVIVLNTIEDDARISAKRILMYGSKITHDAVIELKKGGRIRFFEDFSVQGLSDDATLTLEGGRSFRLHELKVRKINDIPPEYIRGETPGYAKAAVAQESRPAGPAYHKDDTMVGKGFVITYEMLENFEKRAEGPRGRWLSRMRGRA
ncbi:DnaJ-class molecular chaperone [Cenarchaeum symbiosum A]|uniref:DnaJ-class molecular chaperone n=1 Tax=Cenarchaeum symbiosum (strain A) TaxID=414004 RepID=A0RW40_CENSY|nr:DnaJ-class molecular chaperone [Cenarchaeum symbiosum A]